MGGIGGKGKGARRRQRLLDNAKVFDKKTGTFKEPKVQLVDGKVSKEEMLSAPSSFRRFMEATKRAKEQQERRERQHRIAKGLEVSDDDDADDRRPAHTGNAKEVDQKPGRVENIESDEEKEEEEHTWLRPDLDDGGVDEEDDDEHDEKPTKKGKKGEKSTRGDDDEDGVPRKRKYMSLRERKREARKAAKLAKEEDEAFIGQTSEARDRSRGGEPSFGEIADAPPTITLKRKSGGKGAKSVPVAESGHKIAGNKGAGNRQAEIFKSLMQNARGDGKAAGGKSVAPGVGLRRVAEMQALREQAISEYRKMKGRPMNNGRSANLAADPTRLFSTVGGATIRRDAGK